MSGLRRGIRIASIVSLVFLVLGLALNFLSESLICFSRCPSPEDYADQAFRYGLILLGPGTTIAALVWVLWLVFLARRRAWLGEGLVLLGVVLLAVPLATFVWAGAPWTGHVSIDDYLDATTQSVPGRLSLVALCIALAVVGSLVASRRPERLEGQTLTKFLSDDSE